MLSGEGLLDIPRVSAPCHLTFIEENRLLMLSVSLALTCQSKAVFRLMMLSRDVFIMWTDKPLHILDPGHSSLFKWYTCHIFFYTTSINAIWIICNFVIILALSCLKTYFQWTCLWVLIFNDPLGRLFIRSGDMKWWGRGILSTWPLQPTTYTALFTWVLRTH